MQCLVDPCSIPAASCPSPLPRGTVCYANYCNASYTFTGVGADGSKTSYTVGPCGAVWARNGAVLCAK